MFEKVSAEDTTLAKLLSEIEQAKKAKEKSYPPVLKEKVLEYIANTKITQKSFAARSGLSSSTIQRWADAKPAPIKKINKLLPSIVNTPIINPVVPKPVSDYVLIKKNGIEIELPVRYLAQVLKEL